MKKKKRSLEKSLLSLILLIACFIYSTFELEKASATPEEGDPPFLYANMAGDALQKTLLASIEKARQSILLMIYSLTDPEIIQALKKKSEEGVNVQVIYDAKASAGVNLKLGKLVRTTARASDGLMHLKLLVVDELEVWIGSANMTSDSLLSQGNLIAALKSNRVAQAVLKKAKCVSEDLYEMPIAAQQIDLGSQPIELWFLPDNGQSAVRRIEELIRGAKKTIKVAMFTFTRADFAKALVRAKNRGVDVEVYLDRSSAKGASAQVVAQLKKGGVPIYLNSGPSLFHYKFLLIDDEILANGSANWTKAAFKQNDDCFMIITNLTEAQKTKMAELVNSFKNTTTPLKIALFGRGKMGKIVEELALENGHQITHPERADICIDFTHPSAVLNNIKTAASLKKNIVVGTTGWHEQLEQAKDIVKGSEIGLLFSPNFSVGVHLYLKALKSCADLVQKHEEYDVGGLEIHHNQKVDSPSGTAKAISKLLLDSFKSKKRAVYGHPESKLAPEELHFSSLRVGHIPGTHTVIFDSPYDSITVTHTAKGRAGFALGALKAAEWLNGKKGFYTLEDML